MDVADIAGRLTRKQAHVIASMVPYHWHSRYDHKSFKQPGSVMRHLAVKGITELTRLGEDGPPYHRLTPLGLAVRAHIQGNSHD